MPKPLMHGGHATLFLQETLACKCFDAVPVFHDCREKKRIPNNNPSPALAAVNALLDWVRCPPTSVLENIEREPNVTKSFLRHWRFNSGDRNAIFKAAARKLSFSHRANGVPA